MRFFIFVSMVLTSMTFQAAQADMSCQFLCVKFNDNAYTKMGHYIYGVITIDTVDLAVTSKNSTDALQAARKSCGHNSEYSAWSLRFKSRPTNYVPLPLAQVWGGCSVDANQKSLLDYDCKSVAASLNRDEVIWRNIRSYSDDKTVAEYFDSMFCSGENKDPVQPQIFVDGMPSSSIK